MRIKGYEFSLREFAGALGDFGPLNPFLIGYIAILGLSPAGIFLAMGLSNIILGLIYKLPLSIEAKKAIGTVALKEKWEPSQVYMSGILTGIFWLFLSFSGLVRKLAKVTPLIVVRGIQFGLVLILLKQALELMQADLILALASVIIILLLLRNRFLPSAIAVFMLGIVIVFLSTPGLRLEVGFSLPKFIIPSFQTITLSLLAVVLAQIILTFSNAILAASLTIKQRFPGREIGEENLAKNMGIINAFSPFIGGAPVCHGAEGIASQYFFGARTGGAMIMEGFTEIVLSLFFANSVQVIFGNFPLAIIGAMLLFVCIELGKFFLTLREKVEITLILIVGIFSLFTNLAIGFVVGIILFFLLKKIKVGL